MKKLGLCLLPLLLLGGCDKKSSENRNTSVVEQNRYTQINEYYGVEYNFDNYLRCCVEYKHYKGNEETGYVLEYTKNWCVYLTGFYVVSKEYDYTIFYECLTKSNTYDYYLFIN